MANLQVKILGDASNLTRELQKAGAATDAAGSNFKRLSKVAGVAGLAIAGGLAFGLEKSVKAAMEAQTSTTRLDQAFKNAGLAASDYSKQIDKAEAAGRKLGFTDTETKQSLGGLLTATGNVGKAMKDLAVAQDVMRFTGKSMTDSTKMLTMAMTGSQRAAKQLGITVIPVTTHMDALKRSHMDLTTEVGKTAEAHARLLDKYATGDAVIAQVTSHIHGQAAAFAGTAAGGMKIFHAEMDHLEVTMGQKLLPALTKVVEKLTAFMTFLSEHQTITEVFAVSLGVLAGALLAVAAASAIADLALSPFLLPIAAAVVAIGVLSFVAYKLVTDFRHSWPLLLPIVLGPLGAIIAAVIHWHSQIAGAFSAAWDFVKGLTDRAWEWIKGSIGRALDWIGQKISEGFHHDIAVITNLGPSFLNAAKGLGDKIVSGIAGGLADMVAKVKGEFARLWAFVKGLAGEALGIGKQIGEAVVHGIISGLEGLASRMAGIVKSAISHLPHISIPGFSPIEHVGHKIGQLISEGIVRGLKEGEPPLVAQMQRLLGAMHKGFSAGGPGAPFTDYLKAAKHHTDDWAAGEATSNLTGVGTRLAAAIQGGVSSGLRTPAGFDAISLHYNPPGGQSTNVTSAGKQLGLGGGTTVHVTVQGALLGSTIPEVTETIRRELVRTQTRNGTLGWAT